MCVVEKAGFESRTLGTGAERATNCATAPVTREDIMTSFLRMEVEQDEKSIKLHLDTHVQEILDEYKSTIKKFLKLKQVPQCSLGWFWSMTIAQRHQTLGNRKFINHSPRKHDYNLQGHG